MSRQILSIKNLEVSFGDKQIVHGINLDVNEGEIVGIVGESGSGKSVAMYSMMRLIDSSATISGEIIFNGEDISSPDRKTVKRIRQNVGIVFQDPMTSLNPVFSIGSQLKNAMCGLKMTNAEKKSRALELLELVGLSDGERHLKQYPHQFSGGQRQRIMIAMALAKNPKLLIADEPTTALDVTVQAQILDLIKELSQKLNMAVVMITHDLGVIAQMCDRVTVMYAGRICESGNLNDIFYDNKNEYTKGLLRAVPSVTGKGKLQPIGGNPINRLNPPKGCAFCPRCPEAMKICLEEKPNLVEVSPGHFAACFMIDKEEACGHE